MRTCAHTHTHTKILLHMISLHLHPVPPVNNGSVALHAFASLSEGRQLVYRYSESEATVWPGTAPLQPCLHTHHLFYVSIAIKLLIFLHTYRYCINVDGVPQDFEEDSVELWLLVVLSLLSAGGIGFAIVCIVFDLVFRKKR